MIGFSGCTNSGKSALASVLARQLGLEDRGSVEQKLGEKIYNRTNVFSHIYETHDRMANFQEALYREFAYIEEGNYGKNLVTNKTMADVYVYSLIYKDKITKDAVNGRATEGYEVSVVTLEDVAKNCKETFTSSNYNCIFFIQRDGKLTKEEELYQERLTTFFTLNSNNIIKLINPTFFEVLNITLEYVNVKPTMRYKDIVDLQTISGHFKKELGF